MRRLYDARDHKRLKFVNMHDKLNLKRTPIFFLWHRHKSIIWCIRIRNAVISNCSDEIEKELIWISAFYIMILCHNVFLESCIAYTLPIILSHQHLSEKWQSFSPEVSIWCEKGQKKRETHEQVMIIMQGNIR